MSLWEIPLLWETQIEGWQLWLLGGIAVIGALLKLLFPKRGGQRKRQAARPGQRRSATTTLESPGQFGRSATRELNTAEIRALKPSYSPRIDGEPDPGEIVWTWVPYVENDGRGKDRPVLIIARIDARSYAGCYLSTKFHRDFVSIGTGKWDSQHRESFLAPDRVLRIDAEGMRREGQILDRDRFDDAVAAVTQMHRIGR